MNQPLEEIVLKVSAGGDLTREETAEVFERLMAGGLADDLIERFLAALSAKGETIDEITGAAEVMRRHVTRIACDRPDAIDTCGTGGDGISTFNVSTAAAIVSAGAGATVAKHGNRSNSRKSGSAEVLLALGVDIEAPPELVARCIGEIGIGFLFAARLHPAMQHVVHIRRKIGRRTIFNLLGPLTNPAFVRRQIIGVPRMDLLDTMAGVLQRLGSVRALVVHGHDGLCDFTVTAPSSYRDLNNGRITEHTIRPEAFGLRPASLDALRVGSPDDSAKIIRAILSGEGGPRRDHTLLNAAASLVIAGIATDFADGLAKAADAIDSGAARETLGKLVELTGRATT